MPSARVLAAIAAVVLAACSSGQDSLPLEPRPSEPDDSAPGTPSGTGTSSGSIASPDDSADVDIRIDATSRGAAISPLILGLSSALTAEEFGDAGITLNSWGGNPATRFNYMIGHAWNNGFDYEFRNTDFGTPTGDASREFLATNASAGVESRLAIPMLGWVARNDDPETCSFPDGSGGCLPASEVGTCRDDGPVADPETANVRSEPEGVADWVRGLVADGLEIEYIAMDNEPELWGSTHYDVHPTCTTYEEILDKYLTYARAVRDVAPDSSLAGPVMCCWYDYWNTAPGPEEGADEDFLEWFLRNVKAHDDEYGRRTLDVVDVHYYPQSEVFNDEIDESTAGRRLRSTQSLWDPDYTDESWISQPIRFIPRMKEIIERSYPGTPLLISEWNFGAEETINGALAIAEVLGLYGREGVEAAAYWRHPDVGSPGWFAFKMHGNYDDQGSRFGGDVVRATSSASGRVSVFAAIDATAGLLRLMLINKHPDDDVSVGLGIDGVATAATARSYSYGATALDSIAVGSAELSGPVVVPASSITVLEVDLA